MSLPHSCVFEPEGNACSLTDSTAEEHVLALVEHAADEARDRISRLVPGGKVVPWGLPCHLPGAGLSARPSTNRHCQCLARAPPLSLEGLAPGAHSCHSRQTISWGREWQVVCRLLAGRGLHSVSRPGPSLPCLSAVTRPFRVLGVCASVVSMGLSRHEPVPTRAHPALHNPSLTQRRLVGMWESRGRVALGFLVTVSKERPKLVNPGVLFDLVCLTFYFHTAYVETYLNFLFILRLQRVCWVLHEEA